MLYTNVSTISHPNPMAQTVTATIAVTLPLRDRIATATRGRT
jgi:hypothetical protein